MLVVLSNGSDVAPAGLLDFVCGNLPAANVERLVSASRAWVVVTGSGFVAVICGATPSAWRRGVGYGGDEPERNAPGTGPVDRDV